MDSRDAPLNCYYDIITFRTEPKLCPLVDKYLEDGELSWREHKKLKEALEEIKKKRLVISP